MGTTEDSRTARQTRFGLGVLHASASVGCSTNTDAHTRMQQLWHALSALRRVPSITSIGLVDMDTARSSILQPDDSGCSV